MATQGPAHSKRRSPWTVLRIAGLARGKETRTLLYVKHPSLVVMTMLDLEVSKAVMAVHTLERAVHDVGPWFIRWGDEVRQACRQVGSNGVLFTAPFVGPGAKEATLFCREEALAVREVVYDAGDFALRWMLSAEVVLA